jgi:hypothetical protein
MPTVAALLARLEAIARSLEATGHGLALIGLGSVGRETARLDEWSDLDFFAIVEPGHKAQLLDDLGWLAAAGPLVWHFRNTVDGHKLLYADGVFCECAVFEPQELAGIPYAPGRIVWKRQGMPEAWATPLRGPVARSQPDAHWLLGEVLGNLHVGLSRWQRGERLSALRLIQGHAVDRVLELAPLIEQEAPGVLRDPYSTERRFEQRFPTIAQALPGFLPGLAQSPAAALAILAFLEQHMAVSPAMAGAIRALASA